MRDNGFAQEGEGEPRESPIVGYSNDVGYVWALVLTRELLGEAKEEREKAGSLGCASE